MFDNLTFLIYWVLKLDALNALFIFILTVGFGYGAVAFFLKKTISSIEHTMKPLLEKKIPELQIVYARAEHHLKKKIPLGLTPAEVVNSAEFKKFAEESFKEQIEDGVVRHFLLSKEFEKYKKRAWIFCTAIFISLFVPSTYHGSLILSAFYTQKFVENERVRENFIKSFQIFDKMLEGKDATQIVDQVKGNYPVDTVIDLSKKIQQ